MPTVHGKTLLLLNCTLKSCISAHGGVFDTFTRKLLDTETGAAACVKHFCSAMLSAEPAAFCYKERQQVQ